MATTQAEAAKKIAEAEGDAKSMVTRAQGEADANRIRQNSLTPQLLELRRIENSQMLIEKWNGQLPQVESGQGSGMILQLPRPWCSRRRPTPQRVRRRRARNATSAAFTVFVPILDLLATRAEGAYASSVNTAS